MNDQSPIAGIGHNGPPAPYFPPELEAKATDFLVTSGLWLDIKDIESEEQAQRAADFVSGAKAVWTLFDNERVKQKEPHDLAADAVQKKFKPVLDKIKDARECVVRMQTRWTQKERDRKAEEQRQAAAAAREAALEAERLAAQAASRNDISGIVDAQAAQKEADKALKRAEKHVSVKVASATGGGRSMSLRTTWFADVVNISVAFLTYRNHPEVKALLERLATADVRSQAGAKTAPQGFTLRKEEKAA